MAAVSAKEIGGDPLLELPGFRIGKAGIEKIHDLQLRGTGGSSQVEVNAFGHVIRELSRQEGQAGEEVALTIDLELQNMVSRRFGDESGAAVVMDIHNGAVLALVSTPAFDPNAFNKGLSTREWRELASNPKAPLTNKVVSGQFSPGSTFKMVVLLAALENGVITPENRFLCTGEMKLGDATFHCWKKGGHGWMDAYNGLTQSCDVYFYDVAKRTGIDRIAAMAKRFGFGKTLGLDLDKGKVTLPIIHYLESADHAARQRLRALCANPSDQSRAEIRDLLADSLDCAMNFANQRVQSALACTDRLPESPARNSLRAMAEFIVQRRY